VWYPHLLKGRSLKRSRREWTFTLSANPFGVMAGITPFNFPVMVPMWMFSTAIACGNAFVLKPSEKDPSPSLFLAELWQRAGLPAACSNVVQATRWLVSRILGTPTSPGCPSSGQPQVARHVYETAAAHGKRVQALGGAKTTWLSFPMRTWRLQPTRPYRPAMVRPAKRVWRCRWS